MNTSSVSKSPRAIDNEISGFVVAADNSIVPAPGTTTKSMSLIAPTSAPAKAIPTDSVPSGPGNAGTSIVIVRGMQVLIVRKDIKNMHIGIYPPDGQIKVSTPLLISDDAVKVALLTRLSWIRRHQERFWQQARESAREMVLGESHWYLGRRYLLSVIEVNSPEATGISILNLNTIELRCRPGANRGQRAALLDAWYRLRLRELIKPMIARWSRELGVEAPVWRIQRMKTKWGSCNEAKGHILLNLDLIKKPRRGIDYVVLHEMAHLIERKHGTVFQRLLDRHMTKWRQISAELGALPLSED